MKENPDRLYVHPDFKRMMAIEAAKKGKSIIEFSHEIVSNDDPLKQLKEKWNGRYKVLKENRLDFP
jgi:hypothetical protein